MTLPVVGITPDSFESARLLLRPWQQRDAEPWNEMNADPMVRQYFPDLLDSATAGAQMQHAANFIEAHGWGLWVVELKETGQFIGATGLVPLPEGVPGYGGVEIGWRLIRSAWGNGYATEAAQRALQVAHEVAQLQEVYSMTAVLNRPSIAVMKRLNMELYQHFDHPRIYEYSPLRPHVMYRRELPWKPA